MRELAFRPRNMKPSLMSSKIAFHQKHYSLERFLIGICDLPERAEITWTGAAGRFVSHTYYKFSHHQEDTASKIGRNQFSTPLKNTIRPRCKYTNEDKTSPVPATVCIPPVKSRAKNIAKSIDDDDYYDDYTRTIHSFVDNNRKIGDGCEKMHRCGEQKSRILSSERDCEPRVRETLVE